MAKTAVADIIIPTEFEKYAIERTAELSRFGRSGIVETGDAFDRIAAQGGREVKMPFWKDLSATRQLLSDSASLTVNKIQADQDIARIHNDAQAWSVNHLASVISGDDPLQAIVDLVAAYWARQDEGLVISCLKGMFAAASMSGNLLAIHSESVAGQSATTRLTGTTFIDACAKLGDAASRLTAVAMHSATEAALKKLDLIDFIPDSEGKPSLASFQGRRVVVDDNLPTRAGTTDGTVYTTYLFGQGAFAKGVSPLDGAPLQGGHGTEGVELARVPLDSDTVLINRRRYILHPRGVKFTSASVAADSPTNAELETSSNWVRIWENKNVRLVAITHNN
ncbi:MAG TPA: coat protein [Candidatus Paceibacterota bacterium]|nr:coat protein [Verrucomicrobiota bacterium]HSA12570.1 coat protein [Candidatus Paceibacterota bacterium]